jgi:hypothetical protein
MAYERKYKVTKTISDIVRAYKKEMKSSDSKIDDKTIKGILYELNKTISDLIIRESFEYKIPYKLGFLRIKKSDLNLKLKDGRIDVSRNIIDWKATLDYWEEKYGTRNRKELKKIPNKKRIFQTNESTNGEIMRWFWDKSFMSVKNRTVYFFDPVKGGTDSEGKLVGRHGLRDWIYSNEKKNDYYY